MKNLFYMLVVLIGFAFVSCKKESVPPPTPPTPPTIEAFELVSVVTDNATVDSIKYKNNVTDFTQIGNPDVTFIYCNGINNSTVTLILDEPNLKTETCNITVYFTPGQGYKSFHVLLWKESNGLCNSYGGQGTVILFNGDVYETTR